MKKNKILTLLALIPCCSLYTQDPKKPELASGNPDRNIDEVIATLEARIPPDLNVYKNIILASKVALQAPRVKKDYEQLKASLHKLVATYTQELSSHINDQERLIIADLAQHIQLVMMNAFEGTQKVRNFQKNEWEKREKALHEGSLDKSQLEAEILEINNLVDEKTIEFITELKQHTDQLHLKLLPFRISMETHVTPEEADAMATTLVESIINMLKNISHSIHQHT